MLVAQPNRRSRNGRDRIRLDGEEFEVLDKSLTPVGNEVGFCLCTKAENSVTCSWQLFR